MDYREAGVDVAAGQAFVTGIRHLVQSTQRPEVLGQLGGFNGLFQLSSKYREPVLVAGTDGVGTKLKLAHSLNCHHTVGIDLVAMCANDVLTSGAEPLFFLDYLATGQLNPEELTQVVAGISEGCRLANCALLGGETAEMPGFYQPGEYDLAGFCVGVVEKSKLVDSSSVQVGDLAIALASQGVHSNGFSLIRKIVSDQDLTWHDKVKVVDLPDTSQKSLGEILLTPTRIYVKPVLDALQAGLEVHGMAHITGGGLPENLPRCLGEAQSIQINPQQWSIPPIFTWIANTGNISAGEMFRTFNMGIGFVLLVPPTHRDQALNWFADHQLAASVVGEVVAGNRELIGLPS